MSRTREGVAIEALKRIAASDKEEGNYDKRVPTSSFAFTTLVEIESISDKICSTCTHRELTTCGIDGIWGDITGGDFCSRWKDKDEHG